MCAGINCFSWRAVASTASNCRTRTSRTRPRHCRHSRWPISHPTTQDCRASYGIAGRKYRPAPKPPPPTVLPDNPPHRAAPPYSGCMIDSAQALSGFAVGAIVGLTGVGGGSLMTPLLVLLFNIHPATAVGTDLLHAAITKTGGTYVHAKAGRVDWRITGLPAAGSLPAAAATIAGLRYFTGALGG